MNLIKKFIEKRRWNMVLKDLTITSEEQIKMLNDYNWKLLEENRRLKNEIATLKQNKKYEVDRIKKSLLEVIKKETNLSKSLIENETRNNL